MSERQETIERNIALQTKYDRVAIYLNNSNNCKEIDRGLTEDYTLQSFFEDIDSACKDLNLDMINLVALRKHLVEGKGEINSPLVRRALIQASTQVLNFSIIHQH